MEVEAFEVRLASSSGSDPGGVRLPAELEHAGAGARPERDPPLDRSAADAGERGRFLGDRIDVGRVLDREPAAREEAQHAAADGGEQPGHVLVARRVGGVELQAPVAGLREHAVQEQAMEVNIELQPTPKALNHCHGAAPPVTHAAAPGSAAIEAEHGADVDGEHRAAELVVPGEEVAQAVGQRQYPLTHRDVGKHGVHEVSGQLRHPPPATTRTEAASMLCRA